MKTIDLPAIREEKRRSSPAITPQALAWRTISLATSIGMCCPPRSFTTKVGNATSPPCGPPRAAASSR
jgi:hypothetical protein